MLVVDHNEISKFWSAGDLVNPLEYHGEVVICFDPSKTNMAMVIGTPSGDIINTIEFSGNNRRRGPVMDTTVYCQEVRAFLTEYLSNCKLYCVATEQALTYKGMEYHHSNMVLTEIRANILNYFLETYGLKVLEINNWSWKAAILPKGYRGKFEKGSKKWFVKEMPQSPFAYYFEADITDCICIYMYVVSEHCQSYTMYCNTVEDCDVAYDFGIYPVEMSLPDSIKTVAYNDRYTLRNNLAFYVNRIMSGFVLEVPTACIPVEDIYSKSTMFGFNNINDVKAKVVVSRL